MSKHVQLAMTHMRRQGCICEVVERFNPYGGARKEDGSAVGNRHDLFNIVDILVLDPVRGFVGVQVCAGSGYSEHYKKMTIDNAQACIDWLKAGGCLELQAWRKVKLNRGGKAERWEPRVKDITLQDFGINMEED